MSDNKEPLDVWVRDALARALSYCIRIPGYDEPSVGELIQEMYGKE